MSNLQDVEFAAGEALEGRGRVEFVSKERFAQLCASDYLFPRAVVRNLDSGRSVVVGIDASGILLAFAEET